ncbi:hypothetical protein UlMin_039912 [Ulmus minor]
MILGIRFLLHSSKACAFFHGSSANWALALSSPLGSLQSEVETKISDLDVIVAKLRLASSYEDVVNFLSNDQQCDSVQLNHNLVDGLLRRFKDDWKSALGVFRWAEFQLGYQHSSDACEMILDILGKMKQMEKMMALLEEMGSKGVISLSAVAKVMRRFAGAGKWEDSVRVFDNVESYGLKKNTESMNLLLDTLCKASKVEQARAIFLQLKPHILPNAHTFNIFVHGWCKINRVEEAHWTIQEMKGQACRPCVITYSTIVKFYCHHNDFDKVYEVFDEMQDEGCPPNIVTYTTVMSYMTKAEKFEEALQVAERMKLDGCKPDTLFYNSLIHTFGRTGRVREAIDVFKVEMVKNNVPPNTSTYNTMIAMFCHHDQEQKALKILEELKNSGVCKPDVQTYYPLLKSCFRSGKTDDTSSELLDDMVNNQHLSFDLATYTLLIHGLCRTSKCQEAYLLFEKMIGQGITPRYKTCRLLYEEVKEKQIYDAAEKVEDLMKKM